MVETSGGKWLTRSTKRPSEMALSREPRSQYSIIILRSIKNFPLKHFTKTHFGHDTLFGQETTA